MAKSKLRIQSRLMRGKGIGIKTIAHKLGVSSSTVSLWCRDIVLSSEQLQNLRSNARNPYFGKRGEYIRTQQRIKQEKIVHLLQEGIRDVGVLSKRELYIAGIALYWAEGFKKDNLIGFSNSDPTMIRFMVRWFQDIYGIEMTRLRFRLALNISYKSKTKEILNYWQDYLGVDGSQFQKTFYQRVKWKKIYDHPEEYHGVLRIRVSKSIDLLRKMYGQIEGLRKSC